MTHHIHIFGASGSGTTTLGMSLSDRLNGVFLDTDSYYWKATDPPFTHKNKPEDRVSMIDNDVSEVENWVLSGSICSWGDALLHRFTLAIFLHLSADLRMDRIKRRERERFGSRIDAGGDMHVRHLEFLDWARSYDYAKSPTRSFDMHEKWMTRLPCPVIRLDSALPVEDLCDSILKLHL